jgi:hypothetical protein
MNGNEIRVRLFGGLGNQLFQYYAGIQISRYLGSKLFLDTRWIDRGFGHRGSDLRDFRIDNDVRLITSSTHGDLNFNLERIKTIVSREYPAIGEKLGLFVPKGEGFVLPSSQKYIREIRGYFQSSEYFSRLTPPPNHLALNDEGEDFRDCQEILMGDPFLSVHIRAGDYLKLSGIYLNLSQDYYWKAIESALNSVEVNRVVVFSDNLEYAKSLIGTRYKVEFLPKVPLRASEELVLMSLGAALVIANSTFSYWAAFRSGQKDVFAPDGWLLNKVLSADFYPADWTRIPII